MTSYVFSFRPAGSGVERVTIGVSTNKSNGSFVIHGMNDDQMCIIESNIFPFCIERNKDCGIEVTIEPYEMYDGFRRYELPIAVGILMATAQDDTIGAVTVKPIK